MSSGPSLPNPSIIEKVQAGNIKLSSSEGEKEDSEVYEVEEIENHRISDGKLEYLLKWKGYSEKECTWESADRMKCYDLIDAYVNKIEKAKTERPTRNGPGQMEADKVVFQSVSRNGDHIFYTVTQKDGKSIQISSEEARIHHLKALLGFLEKKYVQPLANLKILEDESSNDKPVSD